MNSCDKCLNHINGKDHICDYCIDDFLYQDINVKTYGDLLDEFKEKYPSLADHIDDYRPCLTPYFEYYIPGAIVVYLKNGGQVLYISENLISYQMSKQELIDYD